MSDILVVFVACLVLVAFVPYFDRPKKGNK